LSSAETSVLDLSPQHTHSDLVLVGAAGFEPTTTRTPSEYATGLRYAPTLVILKEAYCPLAGHEKAMGRANLLS
jgi:hypothetical protein